MLKLFRRSCGVLLTAAGLAAVSGEKGAAARGGARVNDLYPGLCSGLLAEARAVRLPEGRLLRIDDLVIRRDDLDAALKEAAPWLRGDLERFAAPFLELYASHRLLMEIGRKAQGNSAVKTSASDLSDEDLVQAAWDRIAGNVQVTGEDIRRYYQQNKTAFAGARFNEVRDYIRQVLRQRAREDAVERFLRNYGRTHRVEIDAAWLRANAPRALDNPVDRLRGNGAPLLAVFASGGACCCAMGGCAAGGGSEAVLELAAEEFGARLQTVLVDLRESPGLGMRFHLVGDEPAYLLFDGDGGELLRLEGALPASRVIERVRAALPVPPSNRVQSQRPAENK